MKCSHCQTICPTQPPRVTDCPNCGVPLESETATEEARSPASGHERHIYVTPFGRYIAQRRNSGTWAVGYQLQAADAQSGQLQETLSRLPDSFLTVQHPSLASQHTLDDLQLRLVWKLASPALLSPLSTLDTPLSSTTVAVLVLNLASAVNALHRLGHGAFDLPPELIFVSADFDDTVLVPTPTLALQAHDTSHATDPMPFAAPELLESHTRDVDADPVRADIYALGALAWYLLTGTHRYQSPTSLLSEHDPELKHWDAFIDGCCRTRPQRRFPSLDEALDSLQSVAKANAGPDLNPEIAERQNPPKRTLLDRRTQTQATSVASSPRRPIKTWAFAVLALVAVCGIYMRRHEIASAIPGASGFVTNYQRGFGDTILRYADRTYDGARWERLKEVEAIREAAKPARLFFTDVSGWDSQNFYVTAVTPEFGYAAIYRQHNGAWEIFTQISDTTVHGDGADVRLVDKETLFAALGFHESEFYRITPGQRQLYGKSQKSQNYGTATSNGGVYVSLIDSDLAYFHHGLESDASYYEASNGHLRLLDPLKHKLAFVHEENNIPIKEHLAARIHLTRAIRAGHVIGMTRDRWGSRNPHLVEFRSGTWYEIVELPQIEPVPRDLWLIANGNRPQSASYVSDKGRIFHHRWNGQSSEQTVSMPTETTSLDLLRIWGVSLDKYWVLDTNGTVWEWGNGRWRNVVRGMRENDVEFTDAWISPTGSIIAINRDEIYRLI